MTEHALHQFIEQRGYRLASTRYCKFADAVTLVESQQVHYFHDELSVPVRSCITSPMARVCEHAMA